MVITNRVCFGRGFLGRVSRLTCFDGKKVDKNSMSLSEASADVLFVLIVYGKLPCCYGVVASLKIQFHNLALVSHAFCDRSLTSRL